MRRIAAVALSCAIAAGALTGCQSSFIQTLGDAKVELKELDGTTEGFFELPYTDIAYDVELESGTVDLEVLDVIPAIGEDDDPIPTDAIHEADGLDSGKHGTFTDDDGQVMVRVTSSDGATGTISFSADE